MAITNLTKALKCDIFQQLEKIDTLIYDIITIFQQV